jgi:hypothetical protein
MTSIAYWVLIIDSRRPGTNKTTRKQMSIIAACLNIAKANYGSVSVVWKRSLDIASFSVEQDRLFSVCQVNGIWEKDWSAQR